MIPKCTNWHGHKFEARYSYGGLVGSVEAKAVEGGHLSPIGLETIHRSMQETTYERDICVRCGYVIERK